MPKQQARTSTEYVMVPVDVVPAHAAVESDTVEMAFVRGKDIDNPTPPVSGDWKAAVWLAPAGRRVAACLVGPVGGTVTLVRGDYIVWVRIHDNPEVPEMPADVLTIT